MRNDRLLHWLMRSFDFVAKEILGLAEKNVVLIGDAVHTTPILSSSGANTAMQDGLELSQIID